MTKDCPLTEYDLSQELISPRFEKLFLSLPSRALFVFLSEKAIRTFAEEKGGKEIGSFISITKKFPLWEIPGEQPAVLMQAPVGGAMAVLMAERLFAYGTEKLLAAGCCGSLADLPENTFLLVEKALRDEGTSFHYLPPQRFVSLPENPRMKISAFLREEGIPFSPCTTWSTDGFFRETKEKLKQRREEGCTVVDMECASLAACAQFRNKDFAQILFTADTLAHLRHNQRGWGKESRGAALEIGLRALLRM